jgi:hypothetical protein
MEIVLYRGTEAFQAELAVDEETGEIGADYPLDVLVRRNPVGTTAFILNTKATVDMIDAHIAKMQAKKRALVNNAERAKESLKQVMAATGVLSIKSDDGTFSAVLSPGRDESVEVFDAAQLPADYMREVPAKLEPDKVLIRAALKDNFDVPGAKLVKRDRLTLR